MKGVGGGGLKCTKPIHKCILYITELQTLKIIPHICKNFNFNMFGLSPLYMQNAFLKRFLAIKFSLVNRFCKIFVAFFKTWNERGCHDHFLEVFQKRVILKTTVSERWCKDSGSNITKTCPCNIWRFGDFFFSCEKKKKKKKKKKNWKIFDIFLIFGSSEYPQSMFWTKNKKSRYILHTQASLYKGIFPDVMDYKFVYKILHVDDTFIHVLTAKES